MSTANTVKLGADYRSFRTPYLAGRVRERPRSASQLTREDIETLKDGLLERRQKLLADIARLQDESSVASGFGDPGGYSITRRSARNGNGQTWERTLRLSSVAAKRSLLHEIDQALARIENNTYGICTETRKPIPLERLREIPWARSS